MCNSRRTRIIAVCSIATVVQLAQGQGPTGPLGTWRGGIATQLTTNQGIRTTQSDAYTLVMRPDGICEWTMSPDRTGRDHKCEWKMNGKHVIIHIEGLESAEAELRIYKNQTNGELDFKPIKHRRFINIDLTRVQ
jgi:hypothetical protein